MKRWSDDVWRQRGKRDNFASSTTIDAAQRHADKTEITVNGQQRTRQTQQIIMIQKKRGNKRPYKMPTAALFHFYWLARQIGLHIQHIVRSINFNLMIIMIGLLEVISWCPVLSLTLLLSVSSTCVFSNRQTDKSSFRWWSHAKPSNPIRPSIIQTNATLGKKTRILLRMRLGDAMAP